MQPPIRTWLPILLAALLATAITAVMQQIPTEFVGSQHDSLHIALRVTEPRLFPGDAFVEAASHQPTILWHLIAWTIPLDGNSGVRFMTVGVVVFNFLFFLGVGLLARSIGGGPWASAGAIATLCGMGDPLIAANYIIANHITASGVVAGPLVIALALAIQRRLIPAFIVIGLCANIHVLQAAYVGGLIVAGETARALLPNPRDSRALLPLARAAAVGALCALPILYLIVTGPTPLAPEGWADAVLRSHVIHYFLFSQLPLQLLRTVALLILAAGIVVAWNKEAKHDPRALFLRGALCAWLVAFLIIGSILSDLLKLPLSIKLQPLRATMWLLVLVVCAAWVLMESRVRKDRDVLAWALAGALAAMLVLNVLRPFGGSFNARLTPVVLLFSILALALQCVRANPARYAGIVAAMALLAPASILIVWLAVIPGLHVLGTNAGFQILLLVLFIIGLYWNTRPRVELPCLHVVTTVAWLTAIAIALIVLLGRVESGSPLLHMPRDEPWHEAATYIREHTPPGAIIQGDPRHTGLRVATRRSVFFEQSDDGALYFDPTSLSWLRDRAQLLRMPTIKSYGPRPPWPAQQVPWSRLAHDHGVTHAMVPPEVTIPGEVLFQNEEWKVIQLTPE